MVDCWVLLGDFWWWKFDTWINTAILVCLIQFFLDFTLKLSIFISFFLLLINWFVLQALYYFSCFRCGLCRDLCCSCMPYWYCSLLLSPLYNCNLICCYWSGIYKSSFSICNSVLTPIMFCYGLNRTWMCLWSIFLIRFLISLDGHSINCFLCFKVVLSQWCKSSTRLNFRQAVRIMRLFIDNS